MKKASSPYWILVADSGCAYIFELQRKPAVFRELHALVSASRHLASRELDSDASGREHHVRGPSSHTKQPRTDAHDLAEQEFSGMLIDKLEQAANRRAFEHLAVFADPKTLGRMRQLMSKALSARVIKDLNRDLVGLPLKKLEQRIRAELGWPD